VFCCVRIALPFPCPERDDGLALRDRVLVIDEDLLPRVATYLRARGRAARSVAQLGLRDRKDPELLEELSKRDDLGDWVLVTGNDRMPEEHPEVFERLQPTVATIDPRRTESVSELHWRMDVVQRWAHRMQDLEPGAVYRYTLGRGGVPWTARPRRRSAFERAARLAEWRTRMRGDRPWCLWSAGIPCIQA
jgi:hypothetical protein